MSTPPDQKSANGSQPARRRAKGGRKAQPITRFARFFKAYSLGLSLIVAAVPLGLAQWSLIPMFESGKYSLTIITSVASYLLVGFLFSQRQTIARLYFPGMRPGKDKGAVARSGDLRRSRWFSLLSPSLLAAASVALFFLYLHAVSVAVQYAAYEYAKELPQGAAVAGLTRLRLEPELADKLIPARLPFGGGTEVIIINKGRVGEEKKVVDYEVQFPDEASVRALLADVPSSSVKYLKVQGLLFLGAFLCAVAAFVLMGMKDYLQEELGLSDRGMILNPTVGTIRKKFWLDGVPGVYGYMDYCPHDAEIEPIFYGPYCIWDNRVLVASAYAEHPPDLVKEWGHEAHDKNRSVDPCPSFHLEMTERELEIRLYNSGMDEFYRTVAPAPHAIGSSSAVSADPAVASQN